MRRYVATTLATMAALAACGRPAREELEAREVLVPKPDSLVLERSRCFGLCPAYRLTLDAAGGVRFVPSGPRDSVRVETDRIDPAAYTELFMQATAAGLFALPARIADSDTLCAMRATDHATVVVTAFAGGVPRRVEHYTGCYMPGDPPRRAPALERLRQFEDAMDSTAGAGRWVRPPKGKG